MCGIYGFSLKPGADARVAMHKLKILGIYNESRGRDSCGVFVDGSIIKGVGKLKEFTDFIEEKILPIPENNLVVIGHNRWSTKGSHIEANAHPFLINDDLVGVHNGTVQNMVELCNKYGYEFKDFDVDSHLLYTIMGNHGYEVLNHYKGYAALAFTYKKAPNVLYLYHGSSRVSKHGQLVEERPLCYMETEEGLYFSSMASSLWAIREKEEELPFDLDVNQIFTVENGELTAEALVVEREDANIDINATYSRVGKQTRAFNKSFGTTKTNGPHGCAVVNKDALNSVLSNVDYQEPMIMRETLPLKVLNTKSGNYVYFHQNRYWENPRRLCQGIYRLKDKGGYMDAKDGIPFFFWAGVMLKDNDAYQALLTLSADKNSFLFRQMTSNFAGLISKYSKYPVTNVNNQGSQYTTYYQNAFFLDDKRARNMSCTYKFSGRNYILDDRGFLSDIKCSQRETPLLPTEELARQELNMFLNGEGLIGTSGGSTGPVPFCGSIKNFDVAPILGPEGPGGFSITRTCKNTGKSNSDKRKISYDPDAKSKLYISRYTDYESPFESDDEKDQLFYDIIFRDLKHAEDHIDDPEIKTLQQFCKLYLANQYPTEPDAVEIDEMVKDLVITAINRKIRIIDTCLDSRECELMMSLYDKELEKAEEEQDGGDESDEYLELGDESIHANAYGAMMVDSIDAKVNDNENHDDDMEYDASLAIAQYSHMLKEMIKDQKKHDMMHENDKDENDTFPNIEPDFDVERSFNDLKDMREDADTLFLREDSEYAQDAASVLYRTVDSALLELRTIAEKHKDKGMSTKITEYINKPGAKV